MHHKFYFNSWKLSTFVFLFQVSLTQLPVHDKCLTLFLNCFLLISFSFSSVNHKHTKMQKTNYQKCQNLSYHVLSYSKSFLGNRRHVKNSDSHCDEWSSSCVHSAKPLERWKKTQLSPYSVPGVPAKESAHNREVPNPFSHLCLSSSSFFSFLQNL